MDDKEYYSLMNRSVCAFNLKEIIKKSQEKKSNEVKLNSGISEGRQGREDKEMLHEKKGDFNLE